MPKAMIMAAGIGTRLYPLTKDRPKALVEYNGKTLLQYTLENLKKFNFQDVIINVHHHSAMITDYLRDHDYFGLNISFSDETEALLETGGGLMKASWFFDSGPFLVCNVDVQTELNLSKLLEYHLNNSAIATLAVKKRDTSRPFLMDSYKRLAGWQNKNTGEEIITRPDELLSPVGFSCIYIMDPKIFNLITETGKFSITPVLLRLSKAHNINVFLHEEEWKDLGRFESYR